jgi:predicted esterase
VGTRRLNRRVAAIVATAVLAACNGGDPKTEPTTAPTAPSPTTTEPTGPDEQPTTTTTTTSTTTTPTPTTTTTVVPEPLQLAAEPASGLVDGDLVTVTGSGLRTTDVIVIGECLDIAPLTVDDCEPAALTRPEGRYSLAENGILDTTFRVFARFTTRGGEAVDCRGRETECLLVAASALSDDPLAGSTIPVSFDPDGALAEPGVSVTDTDELVDGDPIGVSVWGLPPTTPVAIGQCLIVDGLAGACETEIEVFAARQTADETGRLATTVWAQTQFEAYDVDEPISCRPPATCELHVAIDVDVVWEHPRTWTFPLTFDATAPLAEPPDIAVTRATDLVDGQTVSIEVPEVLTARPSLAFVQCAGAVIPEGCDLRTAIRVDQSPPAEPIEFTVRARLATTAGDEIDCRTPAADCSVAVTTDLAAPLRRWGVATIGFDPDGPLAPPPTVRIEEGDRFEDRTYVTVIGTGFAAGREVQVAQCQVGWFVNEACSDAGIVSVLADGEGRVELSHPVLATAGAADCSAPDNCDVRIVPGVGLTTGFDEATSEAAPLVVTKQVGGVRYLDPVFDDVDVQGGIVYGRGIDNDGTSIDLSLDVYQPKGDTADDRPVILWGGEDALEFARRGYVVVATRLDVKATRESIELGYENTLPVFEWLEANADELRIDTDRIAAAGQSRGGFIATSLAYGPVAAEGEPQLIAAAVSIAGGSVPDLIEPGEPPSLMLHGDADGRVPIGLAEQTCDAAAAQGVECTLVVYQGIGHDLGVRRNSIFDVWDRIARFLVDELELT